MVVDGSVLIAILLEESGFQQLAVALDQSAYSVISAASVLEAATVMRAKRGEAGEDALDMLLSAAEIEVVAFDDDQLFHARYAMRVYGKGSKKSVLNFGDCFAYALCKNTDEPLLFKGNDFWQTDLDLHLASVRG